MNKTITYFDKPDLAAKNVLLFFHGGFPKNCVMHKDATLPVRMWPNANFTIRCRKDEETIEYFEKLYAGRNISFVSETLNIEYLNINDYDAIYSHYILMCSMRATLGAPVIDFQSMIYTSTVPTYVFFNDENIEPFKILVDFVKYQKQKNSIDMTQLNKYMMKTFKNINKNQSFSNIHILCNQNKISDWGESCYKEYTMESDFKICYLSDIILYDLPTKEVMLSRVHDCYYNYDGIFIAFFLKERVELLNKLFKDVNLYKSLQCIGKHSENLLPSLQSSSSGKIIENELIPIILKKFSWSMYIGKACKSKYLGATFYEPLLAGIPVFIWEGTDPEHKIFPDIDCYFKNGEELISKVHTYDSIKMKELFIKQINSIYDSKI